MALPDIYRIQAISACRQRRIDGFRMIKLWKLSRIAFWKVGIDGCADSPMPAHRL